MAIPLVAALWEDVNFRGNRRLIIEDTPFVGFQGFNDRTSSIAVHPGPDYAQWKAANGGREPVAAFYEDANFGGGSLLLTAGVYPNIHLGYNFGDVLSSVRFNPSAATPHPIAPIRLIVELFKDANFGGQSVVIVEPVSWIGDYSGSDWNDVVSSVKVRQGPNYRAGDEAWLHVDAGFAGGHIQLGPGNYPWIGGAPFNFNDKLSSIDVHP